MIDVRQLYLEKNSRVIVISDLHANLNLFKRLLNKINYTGEDYLFINGDLCEKGKRSLEVIKFVRHMELNSDRIFVTKGNCDVMHRYVFEGNEGIYNYMRNRKLSVLNEMLEINGKSLSNFKDLNELGNFYYEHYQNEIDWLDSLPTAYETDQFFIVHAGLNESIGQTDESSALSIPAFYEKGHLEEKMIIVGHWPVVNYRTNKVCSNNPIIDYNKRIIAIDGGNQIKKDGQLNALIIENEGFSYTYVDSLDYQSYVKQAYIPEEIIVGTVSYPNYDMNIIKEGQYFTLCKNDSLNIKQWVKNEYLTEKEGKMVTSRDVSTTILSVSTKDQVTVLDNDCQGYTLIKKLNGDIGWVPKSCL